MFLKHQIYFGIEALLISLMPYTFEDLEHGFGYLSYFLKPKSYTIMDWIWLLLKVE